jgi:hypothetical protein
MAVVAMLRKVDEPNTRNPMPTGSRRWLWTVAMLDVMAVAWMLAAGDWFDTTSRVTSVVTLGGHHTVVLWLAASGLAILVVSAILTNGFTEATTPERVLIATAGAVSVIALGGVLSVIALVVGVLLLIALLGRAFFR